MFVNQASPGDALEGRPRYPAWITKCWGAFLTFVLRFVRAGRAGRRSGTFGIGRGWRFRGSLRVGTTLVPRCVSHALFRKRMTSCQTSCLGKYFIQTFLPGVCFERNSKGTACLGGMAAKISRGADFQVRPSAAISTPERGVLWNLPRRVSTEESGSLETGAGRCWRECARSCMLQILN